MKRFLECWAEAFPDALMQKLGVEVTWEPCDELPDAGDSVALELAWQGEWDGRCVLVGSRRELERLMGDGAGEGREDEPAAGDGESDIAARWQKWLREVVEGMQIPAQPVAITPVERPRGLPLAPYLLRAADLATHLMLACEIDTAATTGHAGGDAGASAGAESHGNLDLVLDIEVDVALRFGSREITVRELLTTGPGDVLELDRTISDPVDLVVGDKIVARGEVVLVNGNFGLRVTEVAEPRKCLESVRCLF